MEASSQLAVTSKGRHLIVILPALDEESTVGDVVRGIPQLIPGIDKLEVVVIDSCQKTVQVQ